jgi:catechol 2,3-dioxygenase-like lactoylglutathione lyase family enzyme
MGAWLKMSAIQHVGITTTNLTRSTDFYVNVMGGVEVISAGGEGWQGNDVYQLLMQQALLGGPEAAKWAANLSTGGTDTLSARYVTIGGLALELLDYHAVNKNADPNATDFFPKHSESNVAPSVAGNMHISFDVREDVDLNDVVTRLENASHARGYTNVWCNRVVPVDGHQDYAGLPKEDQSYEIKDGKSPFDGWSLAYCKGPDGEQVRSLAERCALSSVVCACARVNLCMCMLHCVWYITTRTRVCAVAALAAPVGV